MASRGRRESVRRRAARRSRPRGPRHKDVAPTVFVKNARYDKMMEAFGGVGVHATTTEQLAIALNEAVASGKPTLINAVIDETAGTESGRITSLNPQSAAKK